MAIYNVYTVHVCTKPNIKHDFWDGSCIVCRCPEYSKCPDKEVL